MNPLRDPPKPPGIENSETRECASENCSKPAAVTDIYCYRCRDELVAMEEWHQRQGIFGRCK